jgi:Putative transmembrane protein (Alph_Pro_TM)
MRRSRLAWTSQWTVALSLVFAAQAAAAGSPAPGAPGASIRVEPREIQVGMFYRGTKVRVEGTAPAAYRVALVCVGREGKVELKRKGKVGGVLWMNVGDVAFEHVPSLFLAASEADGGRPSERSPRAATPSSGYDGVEARVLPASAGEDVRELFREFVRLKEHEQLYFSGHGATRSSSTRVSADFWVPANVPPGEYEVRLLGYQGDAGELLATEKMTVTRVGLAALISSTAQRHGLLYGILSVVVAIGMGFLTGVLFKASRKGH